MTQDSVLATLEDIASTLMLAEPGDDSTLQQACKQLENCIAHTSQDNAKAALKACLQHLQAAGREGAKAVSAACDQLSVAQEHLRAGPEKVAEPGKLVLSNWADESMLREFVSTEKTALEEIEADILALEKGSPDTLASLKRRVHTMKGESGVLGLDVFTDVCHKMEDWLVWPPKKPDWIDRLLVARDWMMRAVLAYADSNPAPDPQEVVSILTDTNIALTNARPAIVPKQAPVTVPSTITILKSERAPLVNFVPVVDRDEETVALFAEFLNESEDGLSKADHTLINIERDGADPEMVNGLFRIFHTIKGVAGALELPDITKLAHTTETMLNLVRQGTRELKGGVLDLVFDSTRMMSDMLAVVRKSIESGTEVPPTANLGQLVTRLDAVVRGEIPESTHMHAPPGAKLGQILSMAPVSLPPESLEKAVEAQKETGRRLGEELIAQGSVTPKQVAQALRAQNEATEMAADGLAGKIKETIKVDLSRVDSLVEMIGELVIVETMVVNAPEITALTSPRVRNYLSQLGKITRDLQDVGMRMRMVPVRGVFQKMARMVRDLGRKGGKQIRMISNGEGTEMDRSMVEQVADPLVHMIRNAVDHGIEPSEDRLKDGKSAVGTITLSAYHEGGSIIIEIADDGRGLNREAIVRKATSQGLIKDGVKMSDLEVYNLIFAPGFSTAAQVTEISGRGVGMDVVKRNVEQMRGRVLISTVIGKGTTFKIVLPLTLAIIDGMLIACGQERYIIPTLSIIESIQPDATMLRSFARRGELVNVRGEILPLVRLHKLFNIDAVSVDATKGLVVVVESLGRKLGLLVDEVITQQQVVIKNLGTALRNIRYIAGAAILSDGKVGLILNMEEINAGTTVLESGAADMMS